MKFAPWFAAFAILFTLFALSLGLFAGVWEPCGGLIPLLPGYLAFRLIDEEYNS